MKTLKISILLLVLLSLSNCMKSPIYHEHLYLWESVEDKNIFFTSSSYDRNFNPSTQSLVEYAKLELGNTSFQDILEIIIFDNASKDEIKKMGFRLLGRDSYKFLGRFDKDLIDAIKENPLYNATETDKNKIEYYPISFLAFNYGESKLTQRLYLRQDTPTHPIDVLAIDNNIIEFQHTFDSSPEYTFVPERNDSGKPL